MSFFLLLTFLVLSLLGVPMAVALGIGVVATLLVYDLPMSILPQQMVSSMNSFILTAVPMFILAGALLEKTGSATLMFDAARSIIGRWRGGLGHVNVIASALFGGKSGSSVADVASLGPLQVRAMSENGYPRAYAASLSMITSTLASVVPPSILVIVAAATAGVSVGSALIGGIGPAVVLALLFLVVNYLVSVTRGYGHVDKASIKRVAREVFVAIPALGAPVIIIGGIFAGIVTPTEAAGLAVVYTVVIAVLFYRKLHLRDVWDALLETGLTAGTVLLIAMSATVATYIFTVDGLPQQVSEWVLGVTTDRVLVMLIIAVILIIVGMFMDIIAAIFLLTPVLMPVALGAGADPIHFVVFLVVALALGLSSPPVGVCLFAISYVTEIEIERIVSSAVPFYVAALTAVVLVAAFPSIVLTPVEWMAN